MEKQTKDDRDYSGVIAVEGNKIIATFQDKDVKGKFQLLADGNNLKVVSFKSQPQGSAKNFAKIISMNQVFKK